MGLYEKMQCHLMGDRGLLLEFGDEIHRTINEKVRRMALALQEDPLPGVVETVPTYRSLLVLYDPLILPLGRLKEHLYSIEGRLQEAPPSQPRLKRIPVSYGGEFGPDLTTVAEYHHTTPEAVIRLHCSQPYLVYLIGFMPGFPYMGELPEGLITPRLKTPRLSVPAGSVAIAQKQTGIYPVNSPGGWRILGRTPLKLFDPGKDPPAYLQMGDQVEFFRIREQEYGDWKEK
jgi:KipI family sensor histidine kinase inhibitor